MSTRRFKAAEAWELDGAPEGLRFSERKLYDECPEARKALYRMARMRIERRARFRQSVLASLPGTALALLAGYALGAGWFS